MATVVAVRNEVRELLGESIPSGGTEADTLFTTDQVDTWIAEADNDVNLAVLRGWKAKLAALSNLVNVTDGAASRAMSDAFEHAKDMVKMYTDLAAGPTQGRSRIGKIVRSE